MTQGDTYDVKFAYDPSTNTLTLSDNNQTETVDVAGMNKVEFGVHCDFHGGQIGVMTMDEFIVSF